MLRQALLALLLLVFLASAEPYYFVENSCVPVGVDICLDPDFVPDCHAMEGGFGDTIYECNNVMNPDGYDSPMFTCDPAYGAVYYCYMKDVEGTLEELSQMDSASQGEAEGYGESSADEPVEGFDISEEGYTSKGGWDAEGAYSVTPSSEEGREVNMDEALYVSDCIPVAEGCAPPEELVAAGICRQEGAGYMCSQEGLRNYRPSLSSSSTPLEEHEVSAAQVLGLSSEEKAQVKEELEAAVESSPASLFTYMREVGERLTALVKDLLPPAKKAIARARDFVEYLAETGAVDEAMAEEAASDFDWEAYERMTAGVGYTPTEDEQELWEEDAETLRRGLREQMVRKAVAKEAVAKAQEMLSKLKEMEVSTEGYQHNVGTGWGTFTKALDLLQIASAGVVGKLEVIKSAAETLITNEIDSMRNAYLGEDDALALGAKFMLEAHQGYAEARATGLGYPPQRFLYGCSKGKYESVKCERDEESGAYKLKVNGKEVVVSHFVRMKDKEGNVYWVGTDDPEAVDEEALEKATIVLREVNGWLWKSDNVEVIDPKTGEVVSEEDLPGMFG